MKEGVLDIFTTLDNGMEMVIERLSRGSVLGLYTFLLEDLMEVGCKCATQVGFYVIDKEKF